MQMFESLALKPHVFYFKIIFLALAYHVHKKKQSVSLGKQRNMLEVLALPHHHQGR